MVVCSTVAPLELMGKGFVCLEEVQKMNGEEKEGGEEGENFSDSGEISDALFSINTVCLENKIDTKNAPWLGKTWENAWDEIVSPPPENMA